MEGMDSTGFIVGLVVGLLGCLLMVLVQTPRMKATAASPSVDAPTPMSLPSASLPTDTPGSTSDKVNLDGDEDETKSGKQPPVTPEAAEDDSKKEVKAADPKESVAAAPKDPSPGSPARADQASPGPDEPTKPAAESQLSEETLKHLKTWLSEELKVNLQPGLRQLREGHREVLKSLQEILEDKSKADQLVAQVGKLESHITKIAADVSQIEKMDGQIANIVADVTWMGKVIHDDSSTVARIEKELADLKDLAGRRHAYLETATDGTQEQLRGLKREVEAVYSAQRDCRQQNKQVSDQHATRFMEILKELAALSSKTHNGFAGLSGIGRSAQSAAQDAKEAAERGLEIGEKTLAAVRVGGPSPSEAELLEAVADIQRTLTEVSDKLGEIAQNAETAKAGSAPTSSPPSTAAPMQMGGTPTVPPPPQHAPNLLNLTPPPPIHPWHQGGPTAAVMLGNPQQIFRALAGHPDTAN
eukprot:s5654_g5.t1